MNYVKIEKALCETLTEIAKKEKQKAIQQGDYGSALVTSLIETFFKNAAISFDNQG